MAIDDNDDRKDLTRIEDLSEFLHKEDPDIESKLSSFNNETPLPEETKTNIDAGVNLEDLDQLPALPEEFDPIGDQPEISSDTESSFNSTEVESSEQSSDFLDNGEFIDVEQTISEPSDVINSDPIFTNDFNSELPTENEFNNDLPDENQEFSFAHDVSSDDFSENFKEEPTNFENDSIKSQFEDFKTNTPPEKFDDIKTFAQSFTYGQISVGGNPPYSVVIRNIVFEEDVESILAILKELNVVNDKNLNETKYALEIGSLLIPQISEYAAIIIAHKLRRFDCDIELGLSDELHPPKNGDHNPRGLSKKDSLRQNHAQLYKKTDQETNLKDIIVSTTSHLESYEIEKYLGIHSSIAIIDQEELDRLKFVQQSSRAHSPLFSIDTETEEQMTTQQAFSDYQRSFDLIFQDLVDQLKQKAQREQANALLAINYQINQLPIKKSDQNQIGFQLICTATLAQVKKI